MKIFDGQHEASAILWMQEAGRVAEQALCHRAKCGSVIVAQDVVIGRGYNAPPLDREENRICDAEIGLGKPKYDRTCCMHAEWRAILDAAQNHPDAISGSTLFFTRVDEKGKILKSGQPFCTVCSRLALDVGISNFVLWHDSGITEYPTHEYNELSYHYDPKVVSDQLETI